MSFPDRRTTNVLLTAAFFVSLGVIIYSARRILLVFVLAVFFAYLINPVVKFMQTHSLFFRNLRGPAVVEVYIALVLLTAAAGYALAPGIAVNTLKLVDKVPSRLLVVKSSRAVLPQKCLSRFTTRNGGRLIQKCRILFGIGLNTQETQIIGFLDYWILD